MSSYGIIGSERSNEPATTAHSYVIYVFIFVQTFVLITQETLKLMVFVRDSNRYIYFQQWPHPIGARSHEIERHKNCTLLVGRNYNEFKYIYLNLFWSRKKSEAKLWWFILADEMLFVIYYSLMHRPSSRRIFDWTIFIVSRWFNAVQRVSICTWFGFLSVHIFAAHLFLLIM